VRQRQTLLMPSGPPQPVFLMLGQVILSKLKSDYAIHDGLFRSFLRPLNVGQLPSCRSVLSS
jgi:hypothetical protein